MKSPVGAMANATIYWILHYTPSPSDQWIPEVPTRVKREGLNSGILTCSGRVVANSEISLASEKCPVLRTNEMSGFIN